MTSLGGVWIPEDILTSIFEETAPKDLESALPLPRLSPLLLGHVCMEWRNLSHGNPNLWGRVYLSDVRDVERWTKRQRKAAREELSRLRCSAQAQYWLDRCGATGLSLSFRAHPQEVTQAFFETTVKKNLHRFRVLDLPGLPFINIELMYSDSPLPLLESLAISGDAGGRGLSSKIFARWTGLGSSPALRKVHVGSYQAYWADLPANIPWQQLTHISLTSQLEGDLFYQFLKACKRLESFAVCIQSVQPLPREKYPGNISLPYLRHFDVRFGWCAKISVFDCLDMPLLHSFTLHSHSGAKDFIRSIQVPSSLSRDRLFAQLCHLSILTIFIPPSLQYEGGMFIPAEILLQLFHHSCHLTSLKISSQIKGWAHLFTKLSDEDDPILPNLQFLTLCVSFNLGTSDFSSLLFVQMALVRSGPTKPTVKGNAWPFVDAEVTIHVHPHTSWEGTDLRMVGRDDILEAYDSVRGREDPSEPPFRIIEDDSLTFNRCIDPGTRWTGGEHDKY